MIHEIPFTASTRDFLIDIFFFIRNIALIIALNLYMILSLYDIIGFLYDLYMKNREIICVEREE